MAATNRTVREFVDISPARPDVLNILAVGMHPTQRHRHTDHAIRATDTGRIYAVTACDAA